MISNQIPRLDLFVDIVPYLIQFLLSEILYLNQEEGM
jgi:hypothetical protein